MYGAEVVTGEAGEADGTQTLQHQTSTEGGHGGDKEERR
jgi:hypothetical protein